MEGVLKYTISEHNDVEIATKLRRNLDKYSLRMLVEIVARATRLPHAEGTGVDAAIHSDAAEHLALIHEAKNALQTLEKVYTLVSKVAASKVAAGQGAGQQ